MVVLGCEDTTQCVCEVGQAREGPTCVPVHPAPPTGASPLCLHLAFWEAAVRVASSSPWRESDCSPWRCASGRRSGHGFGDTCQGQSCHTEKCSSKVCSSRRVGLAPELCSPSKQSMPDPEDSWPCLRGLWAEGTHSIHPALSPGSFSCSSSVTGLLTQACAFPAETSALPCRPG